MEDDFLSIGVEYKFSSGIGERGSYSCIVDYVGLIYEGEYVDNSLNEYVGEINFKVIYLNQAVSEGISIYEVFDTYEYTFRHSQNFFDYRKGTFKKAILDNFPVLEFGCNAICLIENIGIVPKFRGKGLGAKVFKDVVWHFGQCELFLLQPYPLQFESSDIKGELKEKLELEKFEKDERIATATLEKYYLSWGLKKIKRVKDLLFYCSMYRNEVFENIDMDDY